MINKDELLFVVNEKNEPVEPKPRGEVHTKGYWHRTADIWIFNTNKQILCQKRSMQKDHNPGKWEPYFGGHLNPGQGYLKGALQEVNEEVSLGLKQQDLALYAMFRAEQSKEFQAIYYAFWNGGLHNIKFEIEEVDQVAWKDFAEIKKHLLKKHDPAWSMPEYAEGIAHFLEKLLA